MLGDFYTPDEVHQAVFEITLGMCDEDAALSAVEVDVISAIAVKAIADYRRNNEEGRDRMTHIYDIDKLALDAETRREINWLPGDRVLLYLEPLHEGMHPDDQFDDREPELAVIREVHRHPNNPGWVLEFTVTVNDEERRIKATEASHYVYPEGWKP